MATIAFRTSPSRWAISSLFCALAVVASAQQVDRARQLVDPFIGTGGHGHTFPGACVPNGMVQLSPDTRPDGYMDWDGCSGYHYADSVIHGFSHTHLSGTGVADLCDVLVMPMAGSGGMAFDPRLTASRFDHTTESANAGYYKVDLLPSPNSTADLGSIDAVPPIMGNGPKITAELTATARVGVHRYTFPKDRTARIVLDMRHRDKLLEWRIDQVSNTEVVGERRSSSWAHDQRLFYCIRFSHPIRGNDVMPSNLAGLVAGHDFGVLAEPLILKVGISAVSIEGARANLEAEVPHWDFDLVRKQAEEAWNAKLNKLQVKGGTEEQQRIFYTALYHSYVAPYVFNDVDGRYRGMDGQVHQAEHDVYTVFSLWDTFRALHPLMTILEPEMTADWIKTFLLHYQQGGRLPVWELWGNETDCMIGYHSVSVIADAYLKGIGGFDADLALEAMVATADMDHFGLKEYREQGFISSEDEAESVSRTLEYAYDDHCIARMAAALGRHGTAARFFERSRNWQNLYDPGSGFFRARRNGGFVQPFDPYQVDFNFTEANAWQYGFFVPHDMDLFTALLGGRRFLADRLDTLFSTSSATTGRDQADITGLIGQYAHGNEPSHSFAYLYRRSSRPRNTDAYVRHILGELYSTAPDGLSGNEDCGQMSAWYVLSAMGLYQPCPGDPTFSLTIPLFDSITVDVGKEKPAVITTSAHGGVRNHIERIAFEDQDITAHRTLPYDAFMQGGELAFDLDPRPVSPALPPMGEGMQDTSAWQPVPLILAPGAAFRDSMTIRIASSETDAVLYLSLNGGAAMRYSGPFAIRQTTEVTAYSEMAGSSGAVRRSKPASAHFVKVEGDRTITVQSTFAPQYAAGGDQALVDGLRGGADFRTGEWQGFEGQDLLASVDLGEPMKVHRVGLSVLQDQRAWIWFPSKVTFAFSVNGRQWSTAEVVNTVPRDEPRAMTAVLWTPPFSKRVRYIKVIASNAGPCPDWHPGKGGRTWIFADEVLVGTERP